MNKRQLLILWLIAIALGGAVAYLKFGQPQATATSTTARPFGQTVLESFPATEVAAIDIQGVGKAANLVKKDGKWIVPQRDDYPANVTTVNEFIRTLEELKVTQGIQAGPSLAARFGLDETAATAEKRGLTVTFKNATGDELAKVSIDRRVAAENPASPYGGAPNGRYVRNHKDSNSIYRVNESFGSLSDDPKRWLADGFVQVEKIKTIAVTQPDKDDVAWKLTRETEDAAFTLVGAAAGETLDTTATDPLKSLFSYARFDDVIPVANTAERIQPTGKCTATIETVEGFTYTLTFTPLKPAATPLPTPDPANPTPPATDNFALTVAVAAELPKERKKAEDEKPEDAKTKDAAFTERLKTLTERLEKEKAFVGRTFEVSKYTVDALLKERTALLKKDAPAATPPAVGTPQPGTPPTATPPIEVVTPPIAIPPMPEEEPKPAQEEPAKTPAEPTKAPTEPATAPAEPAKTPAEPAKAPAEPAKTPAEPTKAPTEPATAPAEPAKTTEEPAKAPAEPATAPAEPAKATNEPAKAPEELTKVPEEPAKATTEPAKATDGPVKAPEEPSKAPAEQ
ncbi:MAG: DUF4340 domain-containing protein [Verrucomicrobia bacterium]|nr:DUF4340 domain-containing protein [Verrucomicrobiota bacterium]